MAAEPEAWVEGGTYTRAFTIPTKQHTLGPWSLGSGYERRHLKIAVTVTVVWVILLAAVLRIPFDPMGSMVLYILPPIAIVYFGIATHPKQTRRVILAMWLLSVLFVTSGHKPIVNLGRREATTYELLPFSERIKWRELRSQRLVRRLREAFRKLLRLHPLPEVEHWKPARDLNSQTQADITLDTSFDVLDAAAVTAILMEQSKNLERKKS